VKRMAEVGKDFLQQRFTSAVQRNLHRPALQSYSCDSTPLTTRETYRRAWGDSLRITRKGRMASHFDIQRLWFKSGSESTCMFSEPIRLADGTGWCVFCLYESYNDPAASRAPWPRHLPPLRRQSFELGELC